MERVKLFKSSNCNSKGSGLLNELSEVNFNSPTLISERPNLVDEISIVAEQEISYLRNLNNLTEEDLKMTAKI